MLAITYSFWLTLEVGQLLEVRGSENVSSSLSDKDSVARHVDDDVFRDIL